MQAPEHTTACSDKGQGDSSSTVQTSSSSVPAVDQEGTLPQRPKYEGMTFAHLQECLQNGGKPSYDKSVPPRIALQGTPPGHYVKYVRLFPSESQVSYCRLYTTDTNNTTSDTVINLTHTNYTQN